MAKNGKDWTVLSMMEWATGYFQEKQVPSPRLSIEWILSHILEIRRLDLYLRFDRPLSQSELDKIRPLVRQRLKQEPLQYITGSTEFRNATIQVDPSVLIPRPETEELIDLVLEETGDLEHADIVDIGTGSGCIPIALKMERPGWELTGIDISRDALKTAADNAELNKTQIAFKEGDFFNGDGLFESQSLDVVISNPPYVLESEKAGMEKQVVDFEPGLALFTSDLPGVYSAIRDVATVWLKPEGWLFLEIHEDFGSEILALFSGENWRSEIKKDASKKDRFIACKRLIVS